MKDPQAWLDAIALEVHPEWGTQPPPAYDPREVLEHVRALVAKGDWPLRARQFSGSLGDGRTWLATASGRPEFWDEVAPFPQKAPERDIGPGPAVIGLSVPADNPAAPRGPVTALEIAARRTFDAQREAARAKVDELRPAATEAFRPRPLIARDAYPSNPLAARPQDVEAWFHAHGVVVRVVFERGEVLVDAIRLLT